MQRPLSVGIIIVLLSNSFSRCMGCRWQPTAGGGIICSHAWVAPRPASSESCVLTLPPSGSRFYDACHPTTCGCPAGSGTMPRLQRRVGVTPILNTSSRGMGCPRQPAAGGGIIPYLSGYSKVLLFPTSRTSCRWMNTRKVRDQHGVTEVRSNRCLASSWTCSNVPGAEG